MSDRAIVLDANILILAVLGKRVRELIVDNADRVQFFYPMSLTLTPESTFPRCWKKEALTVGQQWQFWMRWNPLSGL